MAIPLPTRAATHAAASQARESQSVTALLRRLTHELAALFRQELALAGAECVQTLQRILTAAAGVAAGGVVLFVGLLALVAAAILGLSQVMAPWVAALLIGGVASVVGLLLIVMAARKLHPESLKPQRSVRSLIKDKDVLSRKSS